MGTIAATFTDGGAIMRFLLIALLIASSNVAAGGTVAPIAQAPTLGEFGLIALAVAVGVAGGILARRKKK
jgi:exosortase sorting signal-containing protein